MPPRLPDVPSIVPRKVTLPRGREARRDAVMDVRPRTFSDACPTTPTVSRTRGRYEAVTVADPLATATRARHRPVASVVTVPIALGLMPLACGARVSSTAAPVTGLPSEVVTRPLSVAVPLGA
jgi:hypothetical protein